jgi:lipid-binding SYLF domain-containing protein
MRTKVTTFICVLLVLLLAAPLPAQFRKKDPKKKRDKLDQVVEETIEKLFDENPRGKQLFNESFGYAVFDSRKTSFALAGGGGRGVAVERSSGKRTYMRTASIGVNLGIGIQFYQIVFLFEDESHFRTFVDSGWEVGTSANAVGGDEGQNVTAKATDKDAVAVGANEKIGFTEGIAVFQFTEKGLMIQADISGTKYWKDDKFNDL